MQSSNLPSTPSAKSRSPLPKVLGLILLGAIGWGIWSKLSSSNPSTRMSEGDRILINDKNSEAKQRAAKLVEQRDDTQALQAFQAILDQNRNDPESLIYLNNLKATKASENNFSVGVSVPISVNPNVAQEILRGVAQAQDELNTSGGIAGRRMRVTIADDSNDPTIATQIAQEFAKNQSLLGVIGHNSSEASLAAAVVYQANQVVMISPTSGTDRLTGFGSYIFRTIPRTNFFSNPLVKYVVNTYPKKRIGLCQDSKSKDNLSFRDGFVASLVGEGGEMVALDCELSSPDFNAQSVINRAASEQVDAILICPHIDRLGQVITLAQANQSRIPLLSSQTLYTSKTLEGGSNVAGLVIPVFWHPGLNPDFSQRATQYWSGPVNWRTATSYDATLAIVKAASSTVTPTRDSIQSNLRAGKFSTTGSTGDVKFMDTGDRQGTPVLMTVQPTTTGFAFVPIGDAVKPQTSNNNQKPAKDSSSGPF
jgi:branched-chain amino acid transport system substrate-binding protein